YFNRGVLATQSIALRLSDKEPWKTQLTKIITTPGDDTRDYLSGELRLAMLKLLDDVKQTDGELVHAALFELNDPELIDRRCQLGARAHVVLSNGDEPKGDENKAGRDQLSAAGVDVHDRMTGSRLGHNKFLVVSASANEPERVLTGSTNWTVTGLCTQVNNAV